MAITATLLRLGAWFPANDSFGPHPASPTGAIIDLNDGSTFSLVDSGKGEGDGLDWGAPVPNVLNSGNVRTTGKAIKTRRYTENRTVKATLFWGQGSAYATWISAIHNLVGLCEGITSEKPAALLVQVTGAATPLYLDVLEAHVEIPYNELLWAQLLEKGLVITFTCKPHFRGPITTLQNLVTNPGFEAPSGPGVTVFSDAFATLNAYTTQAGSSPTQDKAYYSDAVQADGPLRYYRLDEASGLVANDAVSGQNGTISGTGITYGVAGALTGDSDTAMTFVSAASGTVSLPLAGLPTGNGSWSVEAWVKLAAYPSGTSAMVVSMGMPATKSAALLYITTSGVPTMDTDAGPVATGSALSLNAWHHLVGTYDGTNVRLYVDGALAGTSGTTGPLTVTQMDARIGAWQASPIWYLNGQIDEVAIYGTALSLGRVSAHYTAGTTTPATATNTMLLAANSTVSFGSPNWTAINAWQFRFRWTSGATLYAYYHYTDANNYLRAEITATQIVLKQTIASVANTLATTSLGTTLVPGAHYWAKLTQFPSLLGLVTGSMAPQVQTVIAYDASNAVGTTMVTSGPIATTNASTALQGVPRLGTLTGSIGFGIPNGPTATQTLSLFGPGGWTSASTGTGVAAFAWEQQQLQSATNANLYTGGPVTSLGAARIDVPAAGTLNAQWIGGDASTTARVLITAPFIPFPTGTIKAALKSTGVANTCTQAILVNEYDLNGNFLRTQTIASTTGAQSSYTVLSGTYTPGTSAQFFLVVLSAVDATTGSAGGSVWWDNAQAWSANNGSTMGYCELFFPQAPAQLMVSGIVGDVLAPASLSLNTYLTSLTNGSSLSVVIGRRTNSTKGMTMVGAALGSTSGTGSWTYALDATAYGGYTISSTSLAASSAWGLWTRANDNTFPNLMVAQGTYHLYTRAQTAASGSNTAKVAAVPLIAKLSDYVFGAATSGYNGYLAYWTGQALPLFSAASTWTLCDTGQVQLPPFPRGALFPGGEVMSAASTWVDTSNSAGSQNWLALIPVDGSILAATMLQYSGSNLANQFLNINTDGIGSQVGYPAVWTTSGILSYSNGIGGPGNYVGEGGPGTSSATTVSVNSAADSFMTLDPSILGGVNQMAAVLTDNATTVLPLYVTIKYLPLYNYPI